MPLSNTRFTDVHKVLLDMQANPGTNEVTLMSLRRKQDREQDREQAECYDLRMRIAVKTLVASNALPGRSCSSAGKIT